MKIKNLGKGLLAAACCLAAVTGTALASDKLTVFSTSDIHGSVIGWNYFKAVPADVGLARISTIITAERAKGTPLLVIDAGDILQGTPLDTYMVKNPKEWKQHPMFKAFNTIGYDAIVCGNHEFNFGMDFLRKAIGKNKNVLSANLIDQKTGKTWDGVQRYVIREIRLTDGQKVRVGIIGVTTPAIPNFEAPAHYAGMEFEDQIPVVKQCISELRARGVDLIIAATHSGVETDGRNSAENQVIGIARACPELSLLIAAHNHVVIDNAKGIEAPDGTIYADGIVNGVPVIESGKDGRFIGRTDLTLDQTNGHWRVTHAVTRAEPVKGAVDDPKIVAGVKPWHEKTLAYLQEVVGQSAGVFAGAESNHQDSAIVDLINDVQRHYAGTQLSAAAAFNTTQDISAGPITRQELSGLYIYENYLYGIQISGAELRQYMEYAAAHYGKAPDYNYDMIAGVDYTIDRSRPEGHRITKLEYQGKAVKDEDSYSMAINDYRMNGGGGYMAAMGYTDGRKPKVLFDSMKTYGDAGQVRSLMERYVMEKGTITPQVDHNWHVVGK